MSGGAHLALAPERCDRCGRCVSSCRRGALKVGGGYIYVDASACDECLRCTEVCGTGAITARAGGHLSVVRDGSSAKVVVASRAEAKALRQRADDAERTRARSASVAARRDHVLGEARRHDAADAAEGRVAWDGTDSGIVLAVMGLSLVATGAIAGSQAVSLMPPAGQVAARSAVLAGFFGVQMATVTVLARRHGARLWAAFGLSRAANGVGSPAATVALVAGLAVATRAASTLWGLLARAVGWPPPDSSGLTMIFGEGGSGLLLAVVALVVLSPLAEELVFRGVLLRAAGARWGGWPAILGTSAVFAAYHATAWTFVPLFVLGVALGWLAWSRRSLRAAVVLHALYNGVVVAAAYLLVR